MPQNIRRFCAAGAYEAGVERQLTSLVQLLEDDSPAVRSVAVQGVGRVLALFWNVLPVRLASRFVRRLVKKNAVDASSSAVRAAVPKSLARVLDNPYSHPTLKRALPDLADMIDDKSPTVRCAFVRLLARLTTVRNLAFHTVCPLERIMARLVMDHAEDQPAVAEIVKLLLPSFFPQDAKTSASDLLDRVYKCIKAHPAAGLVFYSRVHKHVPRGAIVRLVLILRKALLRQIESSIAENDDASERDREPSSSSEVGPSKADEAMIAVVIGTLWESVADSLRDGSESSLKACRTLVTAFGSDQTLDTLLHGLVGRDPASWRFDDGGVRVNLEDEEQTSPGSVAAVGASAYISMLGLLYSTHQRLTSSSTSSTAEEAKKDEDEEEEQEQDFSGPSVERLLRLVAAVPSDPTHPSFRVLVPCIAKAVSRCNAAQDIFAVAAATVMATLDDAQGDPDACLEAVGASEGVQSSDAAKSIVSRGNIAIVAAAELCAFPEKEEEEGEGEREREQKFEGLFDGKCFEAMDAEMGRATETLCRLVHTAAFGGDDSDAARMRQMVGSGRVALLVSSVRFAIRLAMGGRSAKSSSGASRGLGPALVGEVVSSLVSPLATLLAPEGATVDDADAPGDGRVGVGAAALARAGYDAMAMAVAATADCVSILQESAFPAAVQCLRTMADPSAAAVVACIPPPAALAATSASAAPFSKSEAAARGRKRGRELQDDVEEEDFEEGDLKKASDDDDDEEEEEEETKASKKRRGRSSSKKSSSSSSKKSSSSSKKSSAAASTSGVFGLSKVSIDAAATAIPSAASRQVSRAPLLQAMSRLVHTLTSAALSTPPPSGCPSDAPAAAAAALASLLTVSSRVLAPTQHTHPSRFEATRSVAHLRRVRTTWNALVRRHVTHHTAAPLLATALPVAAAAPFMIAEAEMEGDELQTAPAVAAFAGPFFKDRAARRQLAATIAQRIAEAESIDDVTMALATYTAANIDADDAKVMHDLAAKTLQKADTPQATALLEKLSI